MGREAIRFGVDGQVLHIGSEGAGSTVAVDEHAVASRSATNIGVSNVNRIEIGSHRRSVGVSDFDTILVRGIAGVGNVDTIERGVGVFDVHAGIRRLRDCATLTGRVAGRTDRDRARRRVVVNKPHAIRAARGVDTLEVDRADRHPFDVERTAGGAAGIGPRNRVPTQPRNV